MKRCPVCQRAYADDSLTYCLEDGSALIGDTSRGADLPATLIIPDPRVTVPANQETYRPGTPPVQQRYQPPPAPSWPPAAAAPQFSQPSVAPQGRSAAVTALILAILSYAILAFCIIGGAIGLENTLLGGVFLFSVVLALTGAILGIIATSRSSRDVSGQNNKTLSVVALVLNGLYLLVTIVFLILAAVTSSD